MTSQRPHIPALHRTPLALARLLFLLALGLLPVVLPAQTPEGGISISPVRIDLDQKQFAAAVTLRNPGSEEKIIQVSAVNWQHAESGEDRYTPTSELVVNPPLFRVPPGGTQVIRLGLPRNGLVDKTRERSYRVFFEELPPGREQASASPGSQLRVLLRLGVPVFVKPAQPARAELHWQAERSEPGKVSLQVSNSGMLHERLSGIALYAPNDPKARATVDGFFYLLPGETRRWQLPLAAGQTSARMQLGAVSEGGSIHVELPLPAK